MLYKTLHASMLSHFSDVQLFVTLETVPRPAPWDSAGKNTGVGCHALLQEIFPTQGASFVLFCFFNH